MKKIEKIRRELKKMADPQKARLLQGFFKTGKGDYGEGDVFLGITVPIVRRLAQKYSDIDFSEIEKLIKSKFHEERLLSLLILILRYRKSDEGHKKKIFKLYLNNTVHINNWDLVDLSAPNIIGNYLYGKDRSVLIRLAKSKSIWEKRMAVLSTFYFIQRGETKESFHIAEILVKDKHDLIQKAVGWMLREIGKRCGETVEESFLQRYYFKMPRTMLRYAIERFPENKRRRWLKRRILIKL